MADFGIALPWVLKHEGGFSDDENDPGGATMFGITEAVARARGYNGPMQSMPLDFAESIYELDYWRFNGIVDQAVATKLFDMAVNMGLDTATHIAQDVLNGLGADLVVDGHYGAMTERSINAVAGDRMVDLLCDAAADRYRAIVARRPDSEQFLAGWLARAEDKP